MTQIGARTDEPTSELNPTRFAGSSGSSGSSGSRQSTRWALHVDQLTSVLFWIRSGQTKWRQKGAAASRSNSFPVGVRLPKNQIECWRRRCCCCCCCCCRRSRVSACVRVCACVSRRNEREARAREMNFQRAFREASGRRNRADKIPSAALVRVGVALLLARRDEIRLDIMESVATRPSGAIARSQTVGLRRDNRRLTLIGAAQSHIEKLPVEWAETQSSQLRSSQQ